MRSIQVDVDERTAERLETETDLLGFESVAAYVDWIVDNRAAIEQGTERDQMLTAYADRVEELEEQLETADEDEDDDERRVIEETDPEVDGDITPERIARITDDADDLSREADELSGVETERLDAFARRAVAQTRRELGRDVNSGLDYASTAIIDDESVMPGSDVADLDAIEVPGRSEAKTHPRRRAVGAALAYLKDVGDAMRGDFVGALYEDYPAGYETEDGWWNCIKTGLKQVPAVEGGDGRRKWVYEPAGGITDTRGATVTRISNSR